MRKQKQLRSATRCLRLEEIGIGIGKAPADKTFLNFTLSKAVAGKIHLVVRGAPERAFSMSEAKQNVETSGNNQMEVYGH